VGSPATGGLILGDDGLPVGWPEDQGYRSLGYGVLIWSESELAQPDGDDAGAEWRWRDSQARMVAWWYAVDDAGRFLFRRGQMVLPKGSGKSPIAAALSCCELAGPVVFDRFDDDAPGGVLGRPNPSPLVQLAAVSQDQTDNTMTLVLAMLRDGAASRHIPGLDTGITRVLTRHGKLQPVTASAASREGARLTAAVLDETHLWTKTNGGHRLATTIRRNLGKRDGRSIETTNTWVAGELSVAEQTAKYADLVAEGGFEHLDEQILRWHPHADVADLSDSAALRSGLQHLYGDYPWVNIDRIIAEINDLGTPPAEARRFYLNQISSEDDAWVVEHEWTARSKPEIVTADRDVITLGFDGSRHRSRGVTDATALVACRVSDGHVFPIRVWEQPEDEKNWQVPTSEVETEIEACFAKYTVVGFYADPALWETFVASWEARYGGRLKVKASREHPIQWRMNRPLEVVKATDQMFSAIVDGEMTHDGSSVLTRHVLNARRRSSRSGVQIAKASPDSANKIDAAVAAILAWQARLDAVAAGISQRPAFVAPQRLR
jgi:hypothetical protein